MHDTVTTSWRRFSDQAQKHADVRSAQAQPVQAEESQVETWEAEGGPAALSAPSTEPLRILIIDNDIESASSLELMLHASGYSETRVAYSGQAALAIAEEFQPCVVLLELNLLDMSGYEVAQSLREHTHSHDLRLIALTSSREHEGRELARVAGFERYLLKPVSALDLSGLLQTEVDREQWTGRER
jgi:CheY-like chemotaxis protein